MSQHIPNHDQPAFPFACQGPTTAPEFYYGLTKRERIAAMAMQTIITKHGTVNGATWIANSAVECADALLERLKQSPEMTEAEAYAERRRIRIATGGLPQESD